jgi:hypothetical protein
MNQIDSPQHVEQALKTHVSEVEPLYWIVEDSLYKNKNSMAKSMFELLACIAEHNQKIIKDGLHPDQISRLKQIAYELYDDEMHISRKTIDIKTQLSAKALPFKKEHQLEEYLSLHPEILTDAIGESVKVVGRQIKTDFDYACDLVAESDKVFYPIELKIGQSDHAVVSQIEKYCFYFYRQLRYDRYKHIQGIVIANGYDDFAINALRRNGIWIYDVIPTSKDSVTLRKVD